ncbi:pilus assembly protein PilM, partial [bacterium]|nr:pilus assembly protein PilM [bacterium]
MFFKRNKHQKRDAAFGLDLGTSQIKGAVVRREGADQLTLASYAIQPVPPSPGKGGIDQAAYGAALQQLVDRLQMPDRAAFVAVSCSSAVVCQTELPRMPLAEAKTALKLNGSRYLRRDLSNYCLDALELTQAEDKKSKSPKMKVLVAGASREEVSAYRGVLIAAKIRPELMELTAVSIVNAFQASHPAVQDKVVLLVDVGARSTTINFVQHGQPIITRIMHFGGAQLSEHVGQIL